MKNQVVKNWVKLVAGIVCGFVALILLISEPNECDTFAKLLLVLVASKVGAIVCGIVAYCLIESLTSEIKEN